MSDDVRPRVHARVQPGQRPNPIGFFHVPDEPWVDDAICAQTDPDLFFPEKGGSTLAAKRICDLCAAREDCLQYALENDERFGIWGGKSERERRALRRSA